MKEAMLRGPILPAMIRLALPTIVVLVVQTLVGIAETYFVSSLGTAALAGVALVFPVLMLMQMMSNGALGGGVAAAIARAFGAGRKDEADALVLHALVLAVVLGAVFTVAELLGGRLLYAALGGKGATLAASLAYANVVFAGAIPLWIVSLLAAALRGSGNVAVPAIITFAGAVILIPLSPALIFGLGPMPRLGIAGAGTAIVLYYVAASIALIWYLRSRRGALYLPLALARLNLKAFGDILHVGALSAIGTIQTNLTVILITGTAGLFGADAIAGYGIASRLDYLQIPLLFGLGTAVVTMIGTNIGAKQFARARRIALVSGLVAFAFTETLGLITAIFPHAWLGLFTRDPAVLATGTSYLRTVAPVYGLSGLGLLLYFASQGAGRVGWPVFAGTLRLLVAAGAGWFVVARLGGSLDALFIVVAASSVVYGALTSVAVWFTPWGVEPALRPVAERIEGDLQLGPGTG